MRPTQGVPARPQQQERVGGRATEVDEGLAHDRVAVALEHRDLLALPRELVGGAVHDDQVADARGDHAGVVAAGLALVDVSVTVVDARRRRLGARVVFDDDAEGGLVHARLPLAAHALAEARDAVAREVPAPERTRVGRLDGAVAARHRHDDLAAQARRGGATREAPRGAHEPRGLVDEARAVVARVGRSRKAPLACSDA